MQAKKAARIVNTQMLFMISPPRVLAFLTVRRSFFVERKRHAAAAEREMNVLAENREESIS